MAAENFYYDCPRESFCALPEIVHKNCGIVYCGGLVNDGKQQLERKLQWQPDKTERFFPANLSTTQLKPILEKAKVKVEHLLLKDAGDFIVYRCKGRPLIALSVKNGQFNSLAGEIEEYGKEAVQQQAHIVLDILKQFGFSGAVRGREVFPSSARQLLGQLKTYKQIYEDGI